MRRKSEQGFTLIELLVIVSIIAILSALGITSFQVYRSNAAYASSESVLSNARTATQAGLIDEDNLPGAVGFRSLKGQGALSDPAVAALLPGLTLPSNLRFNVFYNPACIDENCVSQLMVSSHCFADQHVMYARYGDGEYIYVPNIAGGGC